MRDLAGDQYAHTLLRQSVRFCVNAEQRRRDRKRPVPQVREVLPRLLDEYGLLSKPLGHGQADDSWIEQLTRTVFSARREQPPMR